MFEPVCELWLAQYSNALHGLNCVKGIRRVLSIRDGKVFNVSPWANLHASLAIYYVSANQMLWSTDDKPYPCNHSMQMRASSGVYKSRLISRIGNVANMALDKVCYIHSIIECKLYMLSTHIIKVYWSGLRNGTWSYKRWSQHRSRWMKEVRKNAKAAGGNNNQNNNNNINDNEDSQSQFDNPFHNIKDTPLQPIFDNESEAEMDLKWRQQQMAEHKMNQKEQDLLLRDQYKLVKKYMFLKEKNKLIIPMASNMRKLICEIALTGGQVCLLMFSVYFSHFP